MAGLLEDAGMRELYDIVGDAGHGSFGSVVRARLRLGDGGDDGGRG